MSTSRNVLSSLALHVLLAGGLALLVARPSLSPEIPRGTPSNLWVDVSGGGAPVASIPHNPVSAVPSAEPVSKSIPAPPKKVAPTKLVSSRAGKTKTKTSPNANTNTNSKANASAKTKRQTLTARNVPAETSGEASGSTKTTLFKSSGAPLPERFGRPDGSDRVSDQAAYLAKLNAIIQRIREFPEEAARLEQQGTVVVRIKVLPDGEIAEYRLEKLSRYPMLNEASLEVMKRVKRFPPLPPSLSKGPHSFLVPINYLLDGATG